ncbi:LIC_10271 family cell wall hydrolase [Leptospira idonii]|uniref:LysM peptidoglycan-binding domain-containing protein n=1 Tax=Leptospira idonii TaxID=1193500 RepID=A0A4R9M3L8_9LEPT|nr:peptidoglycan DD-metalloendopeptidase family protein [Leptospira idonii]TGN20571.1 LysM peptidoglycan-binding domain-containing protein [Leptospira idonii]
MRVFTTKYILLLILLLLFPWEGNAKQNASNLSNVYRVQKGDSWWGIAKKFKMNPKDLAALNGRTDKEALYQNELLKVSGSTSLSSQQSVSKTKLSSKPNFPLPHWEKIEKQYSELTYDPHKGVRYSKQNSAWVRTALAGKVVHIDYMDGYENYIVLEHENGWYSVYGNLERVQVTEGQSLAAKERLGTLAKDKGLYFQVNQNKTAVNPGVFLGQGK